MLPPLYTNKMSDSNSERTLSPEPAPRSIAVDSNNATTQSSTNDVTRESTAVAPPDNVDYEENPELYGLRRSRRAHIAPQRFTVEEERIKRRSKYTEYSSSDSDSDRPRTKRRAKSRKQRRIEYDDFEVNSLQQINADDDDDDDDDVFTTSKRARRMEKSLSKKRRRVMKRGDEDIQTPSAMRFSTRNNKVVNYNIDDDDDEFEDQMILDPGDAKQYDYSVAEPETPIDSIEQVLDHMPIDGQDPNDPKKGLRYYVSMAMWNQAFFFFFFLK